MTVWASTLLQSEMMVERVSHYIFFIFIAVMLDLTLIRIKTISHDGLNLKFNKTKNILQ